MFIQVLGTMATAYGVLGALKTLLQTRQMLARRSSREVSAGFLASYAGGYTIWLAYGLSTGSLPLIVVDTVGLLCGGLTLAVALALRGSLTAQRRPFGCPESGAAVRAARACAESPSARSDRTVADAADVHATVVACTIRRGDADGDRTRAGISQRAGRRECPR